MPRSLAEAPPRTSRGLRTVSRSALVGVLATATDLAVLAALASGAGLGPRLASPVALTLGLGVQFVGNKLFAFEDRRRAWLKQGSLFLAVEALSFALNLFLFDVAVRAVPAVPYVVVRAACQALVYFGVSLPLWSRIFTAAPTRLAQEVQS